MHKQSILTSSVRFLVYITILCSFSIILSSCDDDTSVTPQDDKKPCKAQCIGEKIQRCIDGILQAEVACEDGKVCQMENEEAACVVKKPENKDCKPVCAGDKIQRCKEGVLQPAESCQGNERCIEDKSGAHCFDDSEPPSCTVKCVGQQIQRCQGSKALDPVDCEDDKICGKGDKGEVMCIAEEEPPTSNCTPICEDDTHIRKCSEGKLQEAEACEKDFICRIQGIKGASCVEERPFIFTVETGYLQLAAFKIEGSTREMKFSVDCDTEIPPQEGQSEWDIVDEDELIRCSYLENKAHKVKIKGHIDSLRFYCQDNVAAKLNLLSIDQWGTNKWQDMTKLTKHCSNLHIKANDNPDLSEVKSTVGMFNGASSMNEDLSQWDMSHVEDISEMFMDAKAFNKPLNTWNVSHVKNMASVFNGALAFNQKLDQWDVSHVERMDSMFSHAEKFNQAISAWNVSAVIRMDTMFGNASMFNQPLNNWDVKRVERMDWMFYETGAFDQALDKWQVKNVKRMNGMFHTAKAFTQNISTWEISADCNVKDMYKNCPISEENKAKPQNQE